MSGNLNIAVVFEVVFAATQRFFANQEKTFSLSHYHFKSVRIDAETENKRAIYFMVVENINQKQ